MKLRLLHTVIVAFAVSISACSTGDTAKVTVKETTKVSMVEQLAAQQGKRSNDTKTMSQATLLKLMANELSGYTLLDVRTPEEFAEGHIAGAVNISHLQGDILEWQKEGLPLQTSP